MILEKLYKKLSKKFDKYYIRSSSMIKFTWDPYLGLEDNKHQEIIVKLISNKEDLRKFIRDLNKKLEVKTNE